jgi:hypothetical protein
MTKKKMNAPLVPTLNTINLVCTLPTYLRHTLILYSPTPSLPTRLSFRFLHQNPVCIFPLTLIISDKDYKAWSYLVIMQFSRVSSYFLSLRPKCFYQHAISLPLTTPQHQKLLVTFQCLPHQKFIIQNMTACIIMVTFSYSVEALAVLFRTSSYCPLMESHCYQACFKYHAMQLMWLFCTVMLLEVLFITTASCLKLTECALRSVNLTTSNYRSFSNLIRTLFAVSDG